MPPAISAPVLQAARDALADPRRFFVTELTATGTKSIYRIGSYTNLDPKDLRITARANAAVLPATDVAFEVVDSDEGYIRLLDNVPAGAIMEVTGHYWDWFSDAKLTRYIGYAQTNYQTAEGEDRMADLLADNGDFSVILGMAGAVEALWASYVEASRMIDVSSPEVSIPAQQRFRQLSQLIPQVTQNLRAAEEALNIGRYKIEMLTLRRVSRQTNRLVPIYKAQEYDDFQIYPERLLPPIDDGIVS